MPAFLAFVPSWAWRWIAIILVGVALFGYGYTRGYLHEEHQFAIYQAKVEALGNAAAERAAERTKTQNQNTKEIRDGYQKDVEDITAYYAAHPDVVRVPAASRTMPATPNCPASANGSASQPAAPRPDTAGVSEKDCALDAVRVNRFRDFVTKNGFPVD